MADAPDPPDTPDTPARPDGPLPIDEEIVAEAPRRAASARFDVDAGVGSEALLREAMDPANQSLAEALRLSFRVLQVVILVLIVLFVFSGFQTVEDGQSGVLLRWGKILDVNGQPALEPGLKFSRWPYPAGEFVLFDDSDRQVDLGVMYWPQIRQGQSLEEAIQTATEHQRLRPGRDGSVLTAGGDIAHLRLRASYDVDGPERFVHCVENVDPDPASLDADRLVELALERAVVHTAASRSLQDFVDMTDGGKQEIRDQAQDLLDAVEAGIRIARVETPVDPTPAFAIKRAFGELQEARVVAREEVEKARKDARSLLLSVAGESHRDLIDLIGSYEDSFALGRADEAEALLDRVNTVLESERTSGEVIAMISRARSFGATVESTLGLEASRFERVREEYRAHPRLAISRLWTDAYEKVFDQPDVEIFRTPENGSVLRISIAGLDHVRETRRKNALDRKRIDTLTTGFDLRNPFIPYASDIREGPGRQLDAQGQSLNK